MVKAKEPIRTDSLLTVAQAAARIGVHHRTIRKWIKCGALATVRVGPYRRIRIRAVDLEAPR